jgi:hypothetical protein
MKTRPVHNFVKLSIALTVWMVASTVLAAQATPPKTTIQDVEKKVAEASAVIKSFAVDQRAEAVQKAKTVLDDIDARIGQLESRVQQKWGKMDRAARQQAAIDLAALRKERTQAAEWYGGLKHGSSQAWEDVKTGFLKSVQDLSGAFSKAYREF